MTLKQSYGPSNDGTWTVASGWGTALASVADAGNSTSGQVDNSTQRSYGMEVDLTWVKDSATGTGTIELWLLAEGNDGSSQDESAPPRGGTPIIVVSTAAETTERNAVKRFYGLPRKFKFYLLNNSGVGLDTGTVVAYQFIDFADV